MACVGKHTKYQPPMSEWLCPKCGAGAEFRDGNGRMQDGWIIQDPAEDAADDCDQNHSADNLGCNRCGYGCSGEAFARRLQRAAGMVKCEHCNGSGLVKAAEAVRKVGGA